MDELDQRLQATFAPGRGLTDEDRIEQHVERLEVVLEVDKMMLAAKEAHAEARDAESLPGRLAAELAKLSTSPDTTEAEKVDFLQRLTQAFQDAQSATLAGTSGDMVAETQRVVLKSAAFVFAWIKPPYCSETLDFASENRIMKIHFLDWAVSLLEISARVGNLPAVPAPLATFSESQVFLKGGPLHWAESQPHLNELLARGPCEWHCVEDAAARGTEAVATPDPVCSLSSHIGCLFIKVVEHEGSNKFDFCYGVQD